MPLLDDRQLSARMGQPAWCRLAQAVDWVAFDRPPLKPLIGECPRSSSSTEEDEILREQAKHQLHAMIVAGHLPLFGRYCEDERMAPFAAEIVATVSGLPRDLLSTLYFTSINFEGDVVSIPLDTEYPPDELVCGEDYNWPIWADVQLMVSDLLRVFPSATVPSAKEGENKRPSGRPTAYPSERLLALAAVVWREEGEMPLNRLVDRVIDLYAVTEDEAPSVTTVKDKIGKLLASADTAYRRWRDGQRRDDGKPKIVSDHF